MKGMDSDVKVRRSREARRSERRAIKKRFLEVLRESPGGEKLLADPEKLRRRLAAMMKHLELDVQHPLGRRAPEEIKGLEIDVPGDYPGPLKHLLNPNGPPDRAQKNKRKTPDPKRARRGVKL